MLCTLRTLRTHGDHWTVELALTLGCSWRSPDHVQLVILGDEPLFFAARDDPWLPTLRLLHKYPLMMNRLRVDTGAIKFVLSGANIMCPGLTSPGATIHTEARSVTQPCDYRAMCFALQSTQPRLCRAWRLFTRCATQVEVGAPVAIYGEDKEHAMAVGVTKMSTKAMRELNKGIGIDNLHYLNDGLWKTPRL